MLPSWPEPVPRTKQEEVGPSSETRTVTVVSKGPDSLLRSERHEPINGRRLSGDRGGGRVLGRRVAKEAAPPRLRVSYGVHLPRLRRCSRICTPLRARRSRNVRRLRRNVHHCRAEHRHERTGSLPRAGGARGGPGARSRRDLPSASGRPLAGSPLQALRNPSRSPFLDGRLGEGGLSCLWGDRRVWDGASAPGSPPTNGRWLRRARAGAEVPRATRETLP